EERDARILTRARCDAPSVVLGGANVHDRGVNEIRMKCGVEVFRRAREDEPRFSPRKGRADQGPGALALRIADDCWHCRHRERGAHDEADTEPATISCARRSTSRAFV